MPHTWPLVVPVGSMCMSVDCFGPGGLPRRLACREGVLRECAWEVGWQYRVEPAADPVLVGNVHWLSGYRHPRCAGGIRSDQGPGTPARTLRL